MTNMRHDDPQVIQKVALTPCEATPWNPTWVYRIPLKYVCAWLRGSPVKRFTSLLIED